MTAPQQSNTGRYLLIGCGTLLALFLVAAIGLYFMFNYALNAMVEQFTEAEATEFPAVEMPEEERQALTRRFDTFAEKIQNDEPAEPLKLTGNELNVLLRNHPDWEEAGKYVHTQIEGDQLIGEISLPLGDILPMDRLQDRYLNGRAEIDVAVANGTLYVNLNAVRVQGKDVPPEVMDQMRQENLAAEFMRQNEVRDVIDRIESVEVRDGQLIIVPKEIPDQSEV